MVSRSIETDECSLIRLIPLLKFWYSSTVESGNFLIWRNIWNNFWSNKLVFLSVHVAYVYYGLPVHRIECLPLLLEMLEILIVQKMDRRLVPEIVWWSAIFCQFADIITIICLMVGWERWNMVWRREEYTSQLDVA